jgi:hypothetical protein
MSVGPVVCTDLPPALDERLSELVRELWQAVMSSECSPADAEERVVELSRTVGCEVLSAGLSERYGKQQGRYRPCACGAQQRLEGYRPRRIVTLLGAATYRRAYYRCSHCRDTHYAGEAALGLNGSRFSLPAQEAISLLSSEVPFERARLLLRRLNGIEVSVSHAEELSRQHGGRIEEDLRAEREQLFAGTLMYIPPQREHRLYVTLDAVKARFTDDWHEARVGAIYNAKPGQDRLDEPDETTYATTLAAAGLEVFGQSLYQEAARRGVEHAQETVAIADGAPWIWNLVDEHFPTATQILDFYHASERVHSIARAVYGEGTQQAKAWADRNVGRLSAGDWKGLLCSLKALRPKTRHGTEAVRLAIGYFETNRQRMDYPSYRARGMHIGSGVVEAACKCVVGVRCKRSGMKWTPVGLEGVLANRRLWLNNRWDEYWQPLKAAA